MNYLLPLYFFLLPFVLLGCDSAKKPINRTMNNPFISSYSRYIKKQVIKSEVDGLLVSSIIVQHTNTGKILSNHAKYTQSNTLERRHNVDYENKKFNLYSPLLGINITEGDFILDNNGNIIELNGVNDGTIFKNNYKYRQISTYKDNKIIASIEEVNDLKIENKIHWQNALAINSERSYYKNDHLIIYMQENYYYNSKEQLDKSEMYIVFPNKKIVGSKTFYSQYNEYGDWTKAIIHRINQGPNNLVITTREIEYW